MSDPAVEREGVLAVQLAFQRDLGWFPREWPTSDYGIDMVVEVARDKRPTGRAIAVQVKSGAHYFKERTTDGFVFRDSTHLDYWTRHSLPVIVVLYDPGSRRAYWQAVTSATVVPTGKGWKMTIPAGQQLDRGSAEPLSRLAVESDPYVARLSALRADAALIRAAAAGERVIVEAVEWVNKSSGRGEIRIFVDDHDDAEPLREWELFAPGWDYADLLPALFPWAALVIDVDVYDDADRTQWDLETGTWDKEDGGRLVHYVDFHTWAAARTTDELRPYKEDGEVARWRLEAQLGDIGRAFLELDDYLIAAGLEWVQLEGRIVNVRARMSQAARDFAAGSVRPWARPMAPKSDKRPLLSSDAWQALFDLDEKARLSLADYIHEICADPTDTGENRAVLAADDEYPDAMLDTGFRHRGTRYAIIYTPTPPSGWKPESVCIYVYLIAPYEHAFPRSDPQP